MQKTNFMVSGSDSESTRANIVHVMWGLFSAFGLTFALFLIMALVMLFSPIPEQSIGMITILVSLLSVLFGGMIAAKRIGKRGLFWGAVTGGLYVLNVWVLGMLLGAGGLFSSRLLLVLVCGILGGAIGGILGVNTRRSKKRRR